MPDSSRDSLSGFSPDDSLRRTALDRFLAGLSESIFQTKLGVVDVQMVGYISDLLMRFVRVDAIHRLRRSDGRVVTEVVELCSEAERRIGLARRDVHRHIGDFTLFWSGMYPESLRKQTAHTADAMLDYFQQGKRAYKIASTIQADADRPPCELLDRLSDQFELCAYGLREIRREWEEGEPGQELLLG